jgi:type IV secretory pathway VirJ component
MNSKIETLGARLALTLGVLAVAPAWAQTAPANATPANATTAAAAASDPTAMSHGLFSDVHVYRPAGQPRQFVMLVSDGVTTTPREKQMLRTMLDAGAMVATVPFPSFYHRLALQDGKCTYGPGAFENLSRDLQAFEHVPGYLVPMLAGADDAAPYVYSVLAQAPAGTFASAITLGFCPRLELKTPPCAINGLRWQDAGGAAGFDLTPPTTPLSANWIAIQGSPQPAAQTTCTPAAARGFVQGVARAEWAEGRESNPAADAVAVDKAYRKLAVPQVQLGAPPALLSDLPIVEVPVTGNGTRFAVLLSGDGGWAGIDKSLGSALAAQGVPVAGFDSLRYFWSARTPQELADDLDRVIRFYAARWGRREVILVGYSQGADVLPFALNRLPASTRASVRLTALLGPGQKASFEFHVSNWIGPSGDLPIAPEALKLQAASTLCLYGVDERDSLCPQLAPDHARAVPLSGGHHFGGEYAALAQRILDAAPH